MTYAERKEQVQSFLGKTVTVKIDRPIGSVHPKHPGLIYPINYGYLPGVIGGDGEELDVYILGVYEPCEEFTGNVIGIIHRGNDVEDKLVAAPDGMILHQAQIAEAVHFQEQYYDSRVEPLYHKSCGAILWRKRSQSPEYLLLFQKGSQTWSFPKGHMEAGEKERETALREVLEETGENAVLMEGFQETVLYREHHKTVVLFLAQAKGKIRVREEEISEARWVYAKEAKQLLWPEYTPAVEQAEVFLCGGRKND